MKNFFINLHEPDSSVGKWTVLSFSVPTLSCLVEEEVSQEYREYVHRISTGPHNLYLHQIHSVGSYVHSIKSKSKIKLREKRKKK